MEECFRCGISGDRAKLYEAITDEGIVKFCEKCSFDEGIPVIKKPTTFQLKESERKHTVYERLSKVAGISPAKEKKEEFLKKEDTSLRDIVNRNYENKFESKEKQERPDLIDNFHWILMRARRLKHLTHEQLAKEIGESEVAVKMAEKGVLPEDDYKLISKLQSYFRVRLIKKETEKDIKRLSGKVSFDPFSTKEITLGDLRSETEEVEKDEAFEDIGASEIEEAKSEKERKGFFRKIKDFFSLDDIEEEKETDSEEPEGSEETGDSERVEIEGDKGEDPTEKEIKEKVQQDMKNNPSRKRDLGQKDIDDLIFRKGK